MYNLSYHPRVLKKLKTIHPLDQKKVLSKLKLLASNPKGPLLNVRRLVNAERSLRMRVGRIRVIFEVDQKTKRLYILDVDYRGNIY